MWKGNAREFGAIPIVLAVLGALALVMLAYTQGLWAWLALGAIMLAGLVGIAAYRAATPHHPSAASSPRVEREPVARDGVHRVLVVADEACAPGQLGTALAQHPHPGPTEVFVVAPALGSRTARWTGDDRPYEEAARHLDTTLEALRELRVRADGRIASHDPLQAADDGLREFPADEIVFAVHPDGEANWLERDVLESARARYPVPVTALTVARS
ncbi:MAG: hypothetical protein M5U27_08790 [Gaiella sp.]|nr:hypothetical protein [Gaiella sp.]